MFFFEKKNQETFANLRSLSNSNWIAYANEPKFFGSFFQKRTLLLFALLVPLANCAKPSPPPVVTPPPPKPAPLPPPPPPPPPSVHAPYPAHWLFQAADTCSATAISQAMSLEVTASAHDLVLMVRLQGKRTLPRHAMLPIAFAGAAGNWNVSGHITGSHALRVREKINEDNAGRVLVLLEGGLVNVGQPGDALPRMRLPNGGEPARTWFACIRQRLRP